MRWIPTELHSHTVHSDGAMAPKELAAEASAGGFGALALTDHNTDSGRHAFGVAAASRGVLPIPGVELTTFFGHVLVWGAAEAPDWRTFGPHELGPALAQMAQRSVVAVGAAHPFRPGNPFCTGCYWEYDLPFDDLDCLEVWSGLDPDLAADNRRALELWDRLLGQGVRITATAGRDWHRAEAGPGLRSTTYLQVGDDQDFVGALRAGRAVVSLGPLPWMDWGGVGVGGTVPAGLAAPLRFGAADGGFGLPLADLPGARATLVSDRGPLATVRACDGPGVVAPLAASGVRWVRAEVWGPVAGQDRLLAVSNPVYRSPSDGA